MSSYRIVFDGTPASDDFYDTVSRLEVEENADLPDAMSLQVPVDAVNGEYTLVGDSRLAPFTNIAVVATPDGGSPQCVFDGYVLSHKARLPAGATAATLEVWGQDASVLMGLDEHVQEWSGMTDGEVANQIFSTYGIAPADANTGDDSPSHTDDGHTLMQRGSDIDFLRRLARRTGRWCRVACADAPGVRTGYFALPVLSGDPVATIVLNDPQHAQVHQLDFAWDVTRPTAVAARQASLSDTDQDGVAADTSESGLSPLDARTLAAFAGRDTTVLLTAAADSDELPARSAGVLRDSGWFARCEGTTDLAALNVVLRVGSIVAVAGCGALLSGNYLVWSVRHTITQQSHEMAFTLVRNAIGSAA